jgi:hypothetical protein
MRFNNIEIIKLLVCNETLCFINYHHEEIQCFPRPNEFYVKYKATQKCLVVFCE